MNNLKTTLAGFALAFLNLYSNGVSWKSAALSAGLAVFGAVAKDYNTTGGTKQAVDLEGFNKVPKQ